MPLDSRHTQRPPVLSCKEHPVGEIGDHQSRYTSNFPCMTTFICNKKTNTPAFHQMYLPHKNCHVKIARVDAAYTLPTKVPKGQLSLGSTFTVDYRLCKKSVVDFVLTGIAVLVSPSLGKGFETSFLVCPGFMWLPVGRPRNVILLLIIFQFF